MSLLSKYLEFSKKNKYIYLLYPNAIIVDSIISYIHKDGDDIGRIKGAVETSYEYIAKLESQSKKFEDEKEILENKSQNLVKIISEFQAIIGELCANQNPDSNDKDKLWITVNALRKLVNKLESLN